MEQNLINLYNQMNDLQKQNFISVASQELGIHEDFVKGILENTNITKEMYLAKSIELAQTILTLKNDIQ